MEPTAWHIRQAVRCLRAGGILAYPTEAVFGLGCDPLNPDAVLRLLTLKQRPLAKGLILIANNWDQLAAYVQPLSDGQGQRVFRTWPGPATWVVAARPDTPAWLTGARDTLAVRVTAHPTAAALCRAWGGPVVSTSANLAGLTPCRSALCVHRQLGGGIDYLLPGPLGDSPKPTPIRDARSGRVLRPA